jgi:hypothetical protein
MMASKLVVYQRGEEAAVFPADGLLEVLNLSRTSIGWRTCRLKPSAALLTGM